MNGVYEVSNSGNPSKSKSITNCNNHSSIVILEEFNRSKSKKGGFKIKCFPKLLAENNYSKFSEIQVPQCHPIPYRIHSSNRIAWGAICLPSTFDYSFHQERVGNMVSEPEELRQLLRFRQLSCVQRTLPSHPTSHVHRTYLGQRLCFAPGFTTIGLFC